MLISGTPKAVKTGHQNSNIPASVVVRFPFAAGRIAGQLFALNARRPESSEHQVPTSFSHFRGGNALLPAAPRTTFVNIQCRQPYGPEDQGVYTLRFHGVATGLHNLTIEVRINLLGSPDRRMKCPAI